MTVRRKPKLKRSFSTSSMLYVIASSDSIGVEYIDRDDKGDPFFLPEYVNEIYAYLRELEVRL